MVVLRGRAATSRPGHAGDAWNDRLLEGIEGWRWPIAVSLGVLILVTGLALHAVEWVFADLEPGTFTVYIWSLPFYPFGILAIFAAQNRISRAALARFRPATDFSDEEHRAIEHELTHQPARSALLSGIAFGAFGVVIELSKPTANETFRDYPVSYSVLLIVSFLFYSFAGPWLIRTVRLLRMVARLHREARHIDLLSPDPVHAFSSLTAAVGVSIVAITTLSVTTDPQTHATAAGLALTAILIATALACFILPLWGMHRRLQEEQARLASDVGERIQTTLQRLYLHVDEDQPGATEQRDRLLALVAARDMVDRLSTWPWRAETPRWLLSALVIPLAIWGATRFLERSGL